MILNADILTAASDGTPLVSRTENLRQPDLPGWVPIQLQCWCKDDQEIWLRLHGREDIIRRGGAVVTIGRVQIQPSRCRLRRMGSDVAYFGIYEFQRNVSRAQFAVLRHFGKGFGQVDEGFASVGGREKEDGEGLVVGSTGRRGRHGWTVGALVRRKDAEVGLMGRRTVIGREFLGDDVVKRRNTCFQNPWFLNQQLRIMLPRQETLPVRS